MLPDPAPATVYHTPTREEMRKKDEEEYSQLISEEHTPTVPITLPTPKRPLKRLNGKQMIRMDQKPEEFSASLKNRRKGCNPQKSKLVGRNMSHIAGVRFCKECRESVSIDENRKMIVQLCGRCKICTCK
ncbi:hypothetical protein CRE_29704 [Caenorhabditis remanei]|uniref:Uncharacterized protein n=1 Tax=Caenorhabditis remanei TaxID=31234 RepID=E3LV97_CAERE|nr:hypothetical protein CRE_29704 [Caenorhabditis remanei]